MILLQWFCCLTEVIWFLRLLHSWGIQQIRWCGLLIIMLPFRFHWHTKRWTHFAAGVFSLTSVFLSFHWCCAFFSLSFCYSYYINYLTKAMQLEDPRIRYRQLQNEHASTESIPMHTSLQVISVFWLIFLLLLLSVFICSYVEMMRTIFIFVVTRKKYRLSWCIRSFAHPFVLSIDILTKSTWIIDHDPSKFSYVVNVSMFSRIQKNL